MRGKWNGRLRILRLSRMLRNSFPSGGRLEQITFSGEAKKDFGLGQRNPSQATGLTERKLARPAVDRLQLC
jgi:hypothetical protein